MFATVLGARKTQTDSGVMMVDIQLKALLPLVAALKSVVAMSNVCTSL